MKRSPRLHSTARIAAPLLLALLIAIAVLPAAALAQPPGNPGPNQQGQGPGGNPGPNQQGQGPGSNPGPNTQGPGSNPGLNQGPGSNPGSNQPGPVSDPTTNQPTTDPHPSAPFTPPANCIVAHAATPAQICPIDGGLQYYFIGADGSSQSGPWIRPFGELATLAVASVYSGVNPKTGKSVTITYLASLNKIRISTYYPDTQYDTDKPYIFTIDAGNNVVHESW